MKLFVGLAGGNDPCHLERFATDQKLYLNPLCVICLRTLFETFCIVFVYPEQISLAHIFHLTNTLQASVKALALPFSQTLDLIRMFHIRRWRQQPATYRRLRSTTAAIERSVAVFIKATLIGRVRLRYVASEACRHTCRIVYTSPLRLLRPGCECAAPQNLLGRCLLAQINLASSRNS